MREILFRGKADKNYYPYIDQWVQGSYIHQTEFYGDPVDHHWIMYTGEFDGDFYDAVRIIAKTLGQYTGLVDKNGNKIFEGDILKYTPRPNCEIYYKVIWQQEYSRFAFVQWSTHKYQLYERAENETAKYMCEVIGNIHDDPELLEKLEAK